MDSNILREYLVSLGFKVDEQSQKKAQASTVKFEAQVRSLTKGVIGVGTAVTAMVGIFASQMEKLYYAAKKSDTTVSNLQAMDYGFRQIGGSAGGMTQAISNMASAMRSNPGLQGLLNSLGVKVTGRDKADVMMDLVTQLKKMPIFVAEKYANMFGIDSETLYTLMQGLETYKKIADQRRQMAAEAGLDMNKASEAAAQYSQGLRELWERMGILKDQTSIQLLPAFQSVVTVMNDLLAVMSQVDDKSTDTAENFGDTIGTAMRMVVIVGTNAWGVIKMLGKEIGVFAAQLVAMAHGDFKEAANIEKERAVDRENELMKMAALQERLSAPVQANPSSAITSAGLGGKEAVLGAGNGVQGNGANGPRGIRNNNPGNLNFVGQNGASLENNGRSSRFAQFQTMEAGIGALANQLQLYSGRGINTLDKIINKYAPSSENNTEAYVQSLMKQTGLGRNQVVDTSNPQVMASLIKGIISHENGGMRGITDDQISAGVRLGNGKGGGASINQTNHISVQGVSDPAKAAANVQQAQKTTNADLVRQFTPRAV